MSKADSLTSKYRPATFSDVVSQGEAVRILANTIANGKVLPFILLSGSQGSGKTTLARIYARALNCEHPKENGDPCMECESCRASLAGNSLDIQEVDAASHRTLDEMKAVVSSLQFSTFGSKYRVILLDECHMLTLEAANMLLKTLEEPDNKTVWVAATTDPQKLPAPIISRAVHLKVRPMQVSDIAGRLKYICEKESMEYDNVALQFLAKNSNGIMRDAVTSLNTVQSVFGRAIGEEVKSIFSIVDTETIAAFIRTLYTESLEVVLGEAALLEQSFSNTKTFLEKTYKTLITALELKLGVNMSDTLAQSDIQSLQQLNASVPTKFLWAIVNILKKEIRDFDADVPVLEYVCINAKQTDFETATQTPEEAAAKADSAPKAFDVADALDDI